MIHTRIIRGYLSVCAGFYNDYFGTGGRERSCLMTVSCPRRKIGLAWAILLLCAFAPLARGQSDRMARELDITFVTLDAEGGWSESVDVTLTNPENDRVLASQTLNFRGKKDWQIKFESPVPVSKLNGLVISVQRTIMPHNLLFGKHNWKFKITGKALLSTPDPATNSNVYFLLSDEDSMGGHFKNSGSYRLDADTPQPDQ